MSVAAGDHSDVQIESGRDEVGVLGVAHDVRADERAARVDDEVAPAGVVEHRGREPAGQPAPLVFGLDLGVQKRDLARAERVGRQSDAYAVEQELVPLLVRIVDPADDGIVGHGPLLPQLKFLSSTSVRARMVGTESAPASPKSSKRRRRARCVLRPTCCGPSLPRSTLLVVVIVQWIFGDSLVGFAVDLFRGLDALPTWLTTTLSVALRVLAIVFLLGGFIAVLLRGRWRLLLNAALAAIAGALLFLLVDAFAPSAGRVVTEINDAVGPLTDRRFPTAGGLAAIAAIVTATAPWLSRNMRRAGWTLVWGLIVARFALAPLGFDTATAALSGWFAGSLVVVLLGGPSRRPTGAAIADGLARVGVPLARLEQASLDARGSTPYFAVGVDGQKLFVKALGLDERSADLLFRMYRRIQPHDFGDEKAFSSLRRAVEHEALVALTARELGVATPRVVAFTTADPNGFVLAYEAIDGRSLDRVAPEEVNDDVLDAIWAQIALLRRASDCTPRPSARQRVSRERRHRFDHRLRLQRARGVGLVARDRSRRTARVVGVASRRRACGRARRGCSRRRGSRNRDPALATVGAERRDPNRVQAARRGARRVARPSRVRLNHPTRALSLT